MSPDIENDLKLLRSLMARELDTINHYRGLAQSAPDADAREFFTHIIEEEKIHIAEAMRAITALDTEQARLLSHGYVSGHSPGEIPVNPETVRSPGSQFALASLPRAAGLTVGSLRGVRQD